MQMSSRVLIPALLLTVVAASGAAGAAFVGDWGDFTARSDRGADSLLISVMENGDFGTSFAICSSIGKRSDPYAADILSWLLSGYSTTRSYQTETLLRRALASLFDEDGPDLSSRVSSNADVLGELVRTLETFKDPAAARHHRQTPSESSRRTAACARSW